MERLMAMAICLQCERIFTPSQNSAGKFCSHSCYVAHGAGFAPTPPEERFWKFVYKTKNCWFWVGGIHGKGRNTYGSFRTGRNAIEKTHRFSWMIHFGPIPMDKQVCHSCDTPQCVNPAHLFLGNNTINQRDSVNKGRNWSPNAAPLRE